MRKYRGKRKNNILLLILLVLGVSVGYAILSTNLNINGIAGINKNTWDIHWNSRSVQVKEGSVEGTLPRVYGENDNTVEFTTELALPGDFYEFTVDAINEGSVDGIVTVTSNKVYEVVDSEEQETTLPDYIKYSVTYNDGETIPDVGDVLKSGQSEPYKIRVEYDPEASVLPDTNKTYKFKYSVTYEQYKRDPNAPYKIKFNPNGGEVSPTMKEVTKGEAIGELPVPVKGTSPFLGWYENTPEAIRITEEFIPQDDITLYARWSNDYTTFDIGQNVSAKFKQLAGNSSATYGSNDTSISSIQRSATAPATGTTTEVVSASGQEEILAWYDNGTIYWYTTAADVFLNEDASYMFYNLKGLNDIDLSFYTNNTTDMSFMFSGVVINELNLSNFDTSKVENMNGMFSSTNIQTLNVSSFNTKNVTDMSAMFAGSSTSTLDLSSFNTSKVTNLSSMFASSRATSLDLSSFDVSKVTNFGGVFGGCNARRINISNWNFASITSLSNFFSGASNAETIIFENVNTSNIVDMSSMFGGCMSLTSLDLSSFDTHNVTNMNTMFAGVSSLQSITVSDDFVVDQVTTSNAMFGGCNSLRGGLGTPYDSAYIDKTRAHYDWGEINPGYFNSKIKNPVTVTFNPNGGTVSPTTRLLEKNTQIGNLPVPTKEGYAFTGWYTETQDGVKIESNYIVGNDMTVYAHWNEIEAMFDIGQNVNTKLKTLAGNTFTTDRPYYEDDTNVIAIKRSTTEPSAANKTSEHVVSASTSKVPIYAWFDNGTIYWWTEANVAYTNYDSSYMFNNYKALEEMDTSFDTSLTTTMYYMFALDTNLPSIDLSGFNTSNVTNFEYMFEDCESITKIDASSFDTYNATAMNGMFGGMDSLEEININNFNFTKYSPDYLLIYSLVWNSPVKKISVKNATFNGNMKQAFAGLSYAEEIYLNNSNTSNVMDMSKMFYADHKIKKIDFTGVDTSNARTMEYMFWECYDLEDINVENFNTKNVLTMERMFYDCRSLKSLDLSKWDTSNVSVMTHMISYCNELLELNLSNWDFDRYYAATFTKTNLISEIVYGCNKLQVLKVDNVKFPENMDLMFYGISSLQELSLKNVDTSNVTNMSRVFYDCKSLTVLDLSYFDTSKVTTMERMFSTMDELTTVIVSDSFVVEQVTNSTNMFDSTTKIVGGKGTVYDSNHIDKEYAHYDYGTTNPGYFNDGDVPFYTVTFDPSGGVVVPQTKKVIENRQIGDLPIPTRTGYGFDGWWTGMTDGIRVNKNTIITNNVRFYAHWKDERVVTFDTNAPSGINVSLDETSRRVVEGEEIGSLPIPTTTSDRQFLGWFSLPSDGIRVYKNHIVNNDITVYGKWSPADGEGGSSEGTEDEDIDNPDSVIKKLKVGDYVTMTPSKTSYEVDTTLTGGDAVTLNPRELNLWRVINIDSNGIDVVSEYTSSEKVQFRGKTGYVNAIKALNTIAKQYENKRYTKGSRYPGYNGQTEVLSSTTAFDGTGLVPPWQKDTYSYDEDAGGQYKCTYSASDPNPTDEANGQGDIAHYRDRNLIYSAYKKDSHYSVCYNETFVVNDTNTVGEYWFANRYYRQGGTNVIDMSFSISFVVTGGCDVRQNMVAYNFQDSGIWQEHVGSHYVRPIVVLRPGIIISDGEGTKTSPYRFN